MRRCLAVTVALVALGIAFGVSSSPARANYDQYFNGTFCCYHSYFSNWNYWNKNRIWRPTGYTVQIWYEVSSCSQCGKVTDTFSNPVVTNVFGYARGWCYDYADNNYSPVTCQASTT